MSEPAGAVHPVAKGPVVGGPVVDSKKRRWPLLAGIGAALLVIAVVAAFVGAQVVQEAEVRAVASRDSSDIVAAYDAAASASEGVRADFQAASDLLSTLDPLMALVKAGSAGFPAQLVGSAQDARAALEEAIVESAVATADVTAVTLGNTGVSFSASADELGHALGNAYLALGSEQREIERVAIHAEIDRLGQVQVELEASAAIITDIAASAHTQLRAVLSAANEMLPRMLQWRAAADESIKAQLSAAGNALSEAAAAADTDLAALHALTEEYVAAIAAATASDRENSSGNFEFDPCQLGVCPVGPFAG